MNKDFCVDFCCIKFHNGNIGDNVIEKLLETNDQEIFSYARSKNYFFICTFNHSSICKTQLQLYM